MNRILIKIVIRASVVLVSFLIVIFLYNQSDFSKKLKEDRIERERVKREKILAAVLEKRSELPHSILLGGKSRPYILYKDDPFSLNHSTNTHQETEDEIFLIKKKGGYYYLESHGDIRLYLIDGYKPNLAEWQYFNAYNRKFTTFLSVDSRILIMILHDNCDSDIATIECDNGFFLVHRPHESVTYMEGIPYFPSRPKYWRTPYSPIFLKDTFMISFKKDYTYYNEYLEEDNIYDQYELIKIIEEEKKRTLK